MGGVSGDLPDHQGDQQHPLFLWVQEAPENKKRSSADYEKDSTSKICSGETKLNWIFPV